MAERLDQYDSTTIRLTSDATNQLYDDIQSSEEVIAQWAETPYREATTFNPVWTRVEGSWTPYVGGIIRAAHTFTYMNSFKEYHALGSILREYEFDRVGLIWRAAVKHWFQSEHNETLYIENYRDESGIFVVRKSKQGADAEWQKNYAFVQQRILKNKEKNESAIRVPNSLHEFIFNLTSEPEYLG